MGILCQPPGTVLTVPLKNDEKTGAAAPEGTSDFVNCVFPRIFETGSSLFGFSPCAAPMDEATFRKPAEAGWGKSGGFADPGVNAWAREKSRSFMNNPGLASRSCRPVAPASSRPQGRQDGGATRNADAAQGAFLFSSSAVTI